MPQLSLHPIADDGVTDGLGDDESRLGGREVDLQCMDDQRPAACSGPAAEHRFELFGPPKTGVGRQHRRSAGEANPSAGAASRDDGAAGTGPHPVTKAMRAAATPEARLERALAHKAPIRSYQCPHAIGTHGFADFSD